MTVDVAIVGGGIAGLASAWYAQKYGLSYVLLEASNQWGGKAQSEVIEGYGNKPFIIEYGPDGFITRKPWALDLVRELDLEYMAVNKLPERIYVVRDGGLIPLPDGVHLLVPTKIMPFLQSGLFSWWGKLRILAEVFIPAKTDDVDESLADFITRRLGSEALERLAEPMLSGVYNADADRQSILATFGQFRALEKQYGSLIRGMQQRLKSAASSDNQPPALVTLPMGSGSFADQIANCLTGDLRLGSCVNSIQMSGKQFTLNSDGSEIKANHVVLATPPNVSAGLLAEISQECVSRLNAIRSEGVGSVSLAYPFEDVPHPLDAMGIVIPGIEKQRIDGIAFNSSKWENRAPDGFVLIRVFYGGPNTRYMLDKSEDEVVAIVLEEVADLIGITNDPVFYRRRQWNAAYPQYDVGHKERVAAIEATLPDHVHLTGLAYHGVGLPDTIHTSKRVIEKIMTTQNSGVKA